MCQPAVRTANLSPDETAYFRRLVTSLSVFATLVLVQPTLTGYERGRPAARLTLDPAAMSADRSLLLDTYLKIILCHGANLAQQRRAAGGANADPELDKLEKAAHDDVARLEGERFPSPEVFECDQYGSKARYLVQKLNPDVPFTTFLQGLYTKVVS